MTWAVLNESDAGTLFEFWNASTHGDGIVKTFKWTGYVEPSASRHTYVIRFDCDLEQEIQIGAKYSHTNVKFKVVGRIAD